MTYGFENIMVWHKAHAFAIGVCQVIRFFPDYGCWGMSSQCQRAAVSISANIAERYKKLSKADKLRLFNIAQSSLKECRSYILLTRDHDYLLNDSWNFCLLLLKKQANS